MRNKVRIEAFGLPTARNEFDTMVPMISARTSKGKDPEHSESEYDPEDDPSGEGDESIDNQTEVVTVLHFLKAYHIPCSIIRINYLLLLIAFI
jgi:hypothetical protein